MNRLFIIGNGFDLAHGLKTDYGSFVRSYLRDIIEIVRTEKVYEDKLLSIRNTDVSGGFPRLTKYINSPLDWFDEAVKDPRNQNLEINFKSNFFHTIYKDVSKRWVDIENSYFTYLCALNQATNGEPKKIDELNEEFQELREKLLVYLKVQEKEGEMMLSEKLLSSMVDLHIPEYYFLNFNYTKTYEVYAEGVKRYLKENKQSVKVSTNNIHGVIGSNKEEPIFGIGDEHHAKYMQLKENKNYRHLLNFSKSQWYLRNSNYVNLTRWIERPKEQFEVYIYGHSCGISDRTLLKFIFEHDNCRSIKKFYHETKEDYINWTYEMGLHFEHPHKLRTRVVPYDQSLPMPQAIPVEQKQTK